LLTELYSESFRKWLITAKPQEMEAATITSCMESLRNNKTVTDTLLENIIGYSSSFRSSNDAIWLAKQLNIRSCLYCNAQSTLTVESQKTTKEGKKIIENKALFQFDHFYPKSEYPLFSLSFYNLIPSCASCNQGKSAEATSLDKHFHPYHHKSLPVKFQVKPSTVITAAMQGLRSFSELEIQPYYNQASDNPDIQEHLRLFRLDAIYKEHKDLAGEIYAKAHIYNDSYRQEILDLFNKASNNTFSADELDRLIVGNYIDDEDLHKRPLAKFMRDIAEDSGLI